MTEDDADEAEWNDGHHDERFAVGPHGNGQQRENREHGEHKAAIQSIQRLQLLLLFAAEGVGQLGIGDDQLRKDRILKDAIRFPA